MSQELKKIYSGWVIAFVGKLISSGNQYLLILIMGRMLGPADVGLFFLGRAIMQFVGTGVALGLPGSILKFIPEYLSKNLYYEVKKIINFALLATFTVSLLMAILLYNTAGVFSIHIFRDENLIPVIKLFSFCLPVFIMLSIVASAIRAFRDIIAYTTVENIILPGSLIIITLILFIYSRNVQNVIYAFLISILISIIFGSLFLKKNIPNKEQNISTKFKCKEIITYSLPFMGSNYVGFALLWMDTFMVGILMNAEAVGIYNGAAKFALLSKILLVSVNTIFAPTISKLYAKGDLRAIGNAYKATSRWIIHLSLPVFLITIIFSKKIMGLYGPQFIQGSTALIILGFGQLVSLSVGSAGSLLNMTGKSKVEFLNKSIALVLNFLLNLLLIPLMGVNGAAIATATTITLVNILRLIENYRYLNIHPFSLKIICPFAKK